MEKRKRHIPKKVRFSKEEFDYIQMKIEQSPFNTFQNFALHMLIQGEIHYYDYSELNALTSEVRRLGNNVNQMAKLAHQFEEISSEDVKELTTELKKLTTLVLEELSKKEFEKGTEK